MEGRTERDVTTVSILRLIKLPDLLSLLNALLGFSALVLVLGGVSVTDRALKNALVVLLLAAVVDGLDGMVARTVEHSPLGTYLDSLADLISFGLAPAIVIYVLIKDYLAIFPSYGEVVLACCGAYVICGMLRLARFNAKAFFQKESFIKEIRSSLTLSTGFLLKKEEVAQNDFVGFPITGSATFLASFTLMAIELELFRPSSVLLLVGLMALLCVLMVSRIRYRNLRDKRIVIPVGILFFTLFFLYILSLKFVYPAIAVVILVAFYMCSPLFLHKRTSR
jgi:CDP-diacylglycerol--serine O-phosphatidyltransferase